VSGQLGKRCGSRKYPCPRCGGLLKVQRGEGDLKSQNFKGMEWRCFKPKNLSGKGEDICWNNIMLGVEKTAMGSNIHFRGNCLMILYMPTTFNIGMNWHFKKLTKVFASGEVISCLLI